MGPNMTNAQKAISEALTAFREAQRVNQETRLTKADDEEAIKHAEEIASEAFQRWIALLRSENNSTGG
jgi:glycerol-3-phosphate O-acyltransferase